MTISIVLYGRNDNYGYNLHKRAALSLNCMAEVLTDSSDEILFVDYNTPDDFPTFPEAIQDTLTERARARLRILRVRPYIHQRFSPKTHLVALEPIARNIAIRRSSPANRWILSTNTDMIFVPRSGRSLSQIAQHLSPGFYHAPRIEIPEVLWESLDRHAPAEIITTVREWGSSLHLNEIVLGSKFILYDGPGDFQLLRREDLFANHGFHEEMLLGWHVDSNIAKRMYLKYGKVGDLGTEVFGYHCDHTRQVTPAHSHTRLQNDWRRFCDEVDRSDIPEQADSWGCLDDPIEEITLVENPARIYVQVLCEAIGDPLTEPQVTKYTQETYNTSDYDPRHMVPFLADMFASMPRSTHLAWYGAGPDVLSRFAIVWNKLGFTGKILVDPEFNQRNDLSEAIEIAPESDGQNKPNAFVFDFGGLPGPLHESERNKPIIDKLLRRFIGVVREERRRMSAGLPSRRVIALNAINNQFEQLVHGYVAAATTPCATHMRHGFVLPDKGKHDWLPLLQIGRAGVRVDDHIDSDPRKVGIIAYGPYRYLEAGCYSLSIKVQPAFIECGGDEPCIFVVVNAGAQVFGTYLLRCSELARGDREFFFAVPQTAAKLVGGIETRIMVLAHVALSIKAVTIESRSETSHQIDTTSTFLSPLALKIEDWLPYLSLGPLGRANDADVSSQSGPADFVVFGPYWPLPAGQYELIIDLEYESSAPLLNDMIIKADVTTGNQQLVAASFRLDPQHASTTIRLPFDMKGTSSEWRQIETRIWSSGEERFRIASLSVKTLEQSSQQDLLPFLLIGDAGRRVATGIRSIEDRNGVVAYSPMIQFKAGSYRLTFTVEVVNQAHGKGQGSAFALIKYGAEILEAKEIFATANQIEQHELVFAIPSTSDSGSGFEFFFQVLRTASVCLRTLAVGPAEAVPRRRYPAVLTLRDWLPFLRAGKSAHASENGIVVSEGVEEFALYGPFWALPAGRYEMCAVVVPYRQNAADGPIVIAQVTAEEGARLLVEGEWRLGQYRFDADAKVEFRLPFVLSETLLPTARTIETRILTTGKSSFRIVSIAVTAKSEKPETNWFPYLLVSDYGVHTGAEIKNTKNRVGYIAHTPPMWIVPGHYKVLPDMTIGPNTPDGDAVAFEVWSGSDLIVIGTANSTKTWPLEFDVTDEPAETAIALRIRTIAPAAFSIRGLAVERVSDAMGPRSLLPVWEIGNWLPFLRLGTAGVRVGEIVLARQGRNGYVVYGPYWHLAAGQYVMLLAVEFEEIEEENRSGPSFGRRFLGKAFSSLMKLMLRWRPNVIVDGGADVMFNGQQIAVVEGFTIGTLFNRSTLVRLPFEIRANHAEIGSRLETRVSSTGGRGFSIRSLTVEKRLSNK